MTSLADPLGPASGVLLPSHHRGQDGGERLPGRLAERDQDRDRPISRQALVAQLRAITRGGLHAPDDLSAIAMPVLVANGDNDLMVASGDNDLVVASEHSTDLARRLPDAKLVIYPDSGHGGVFQHHHEFVPEVLSFLTAERSPVTSW